MSHLQHVRKRIDTIDSRILELLNARARETKQIGKLKLKKGQAIYAPHRETQILKRLKGLNRGPLTPEAIGAIYREIMSFSISLEKKIRIAYLGPAATYTHQAAQKKFGASVEYNPCGTITDIFSEVERQRCDYGVVPVENSTEGAVNYTLDMFIDSNLKIYAEIFLPIHHNLLSNGASKANITQIYSLSQVFGQCHFWLEANCRGVDLIDTASTAEAAQIVANNSNQEGIACIASQMAAPLYGLKIIASCIEDHSNNTTRFLVISRHEARPTKDDKTSIVFEIKDKAGALHDILVPFKRNRINLTKIESRPSKKKAWSYYFFVDFQGHHAERKVKLTLKELVKHCVTLKVLGSYPKAEL
jgi:chorismate mutase / prephenate dehydratase